MHNISPAGKEHGCHRKRSEPTSFTLGSFSLPACTLPLRDCSSFSSSSSSAGSHAQPQHSYHQTAALEPVEGRPLAAHLALVERWRMRVPVPTSGPQSGNISFFLLGAHSTTWYVSWSWTDNAHFSFHFTQGPWSRLATVWCCGRGLLTHLVVKTQP
jgi:hypothetical protein